MAARRKSKITTSQLEVMERAREFLQKKHGKGAVLGMEEIDSTIPGYVSTQSLAIDRLIGNEGLPQSRVIEVFGPEGSGKSTLSDHVIAEIQRRGGQAYLWDTENARDHRYLDKMGVVRKRASRIEADFMERGFEIMQDILSWHLANAPETEGVIVWDTVAGTPTEKEADPDEKNEAFGPAKLIKSELRRLTQVLKKTKWILIAVNQEYSSFVGHQSVKKAYGGGGFPYFASIRMSIVRGKSIYGPGPMAKENGGHAIGQEIWCRTEKNKVYPPTRSAQAAILYGEGIENTFTIYGTLKRAGMIVASGGWNALSWPEVEGKFPKWQGGWYGLRELARQTEGLWPILIQAYADLGPDALISSSAGASE
jgi:recombination protein RecA